MTPRRSLMFPRPLWRAAHLGAAWPPHPAPGLGQPHL